MRRAILLLLALGCDDESLPAKVANAQLHGIVAAQIDCPGATLTRTTSPFDTTGIAFKAQKLLDGSCFTISTMALLTLIPRSDPDAETCAASYIPANGITSAEGGKLVLEQTNPSVARFEGDIDSNCTGFNLEAFGVEP